MLAKINIALLEAYKKGYKADKQGNIFYKKPNKLLLTKKGKFPHIYYCFTVSCSVGIQHIHVHRLQAYQKFGKNLFKNGIVVRHLNGNSLDNSWENIEIGSRSDNSLDRPKEERIEHAKKAAAKLRKLSDKQHKEFLYDREVVGLSYKKLMTKYNLAKSTVASIVNRKTYK